MNDKLLWEKVVCQFWWRISHDIFSSVKMCEQVWHMAKVIAGKYSLNY